MYVAPTDPLAVWPFQSVTIVLRELEQRTAAVDQEHAAGHVVGGIGAEEGRGAGDLHGGLQLAQRDDVAGVLLLCFQLIDQSRPSYTRIPRRDVRHAG